MPTLFYLETGLGNRLAVEPDGTLRAVPNHAPAVPVLLLRLANNRCLGFMFATQLNVCIPIEGCAFVERVQPWRVRDTVGGVTLHEPAYGHVLVAGEHGQLSLHAPEEGKGATAFALIAVPDTAVTPGMAEIGERAEALTPSNGKRRRSCRR